MAIAAVDAELADMVFVTERHRLRQWLTYSRHQVRTGKDSPDRGRDQQDCTTSPDDKARNAIGVFGEDLRHPLADLLKANSELTTPNGAFAAKVPKRRVDHIMVTGSDGRARI